MFAVASAEQSKLDPEQYFIANMHKNAIDPLVGSDRDCDLLKKFNGSIFYSQYGSYLAAYSDCILYFHKKAFTSSINR